MLFLPTSIISLALLLITPTLAAPSRPRSPPTSQELFVAPGTVLPSAAVETPRVAVVAAPIFVPSLPLFVAPPQSRGGWWAAAGDSTATMDWFGSVQPSHTIAAPARANTGTNSGEERMRRKVQLAARGSVGRKSNTRSPSKADRKRIELLAARKLAARREFIGL